MNRILLVCLGALGACAGPGNPHGDWTVLSAEVGGEEQAAVGILEVDRDAETLFRVMSEVLEFDASGRSVVSNSTAEVLVFEDDRLIEGVCVVADDAMTCTLTVDDEAAAVSLGRERD